MKRMTSSSETRIALAGNPNVGKSTVFNALTGLRQHTGNWTDKTVALACGTACVGQRQITLVDLPGTYSLNTASPEEAIAAKALLLEPIDSFTHIQTHHLEGGHHLHLEEAAPDVATIIDSFFRTLA